jgi:hypothetical protein
MRDHGVSLSNFRLNSAFAGAAPRDELYRNATVVSFRVMDQ